MDILNLELVDYVAFFVFIFGILAPVRLWLLLRKSQKMSDADTYSKEVDTDMLLGGIYRTQGMVWGKNGEGLISDSKPSQTYINVLTN